MEVDATNDMDLWQPPPKPRMPYGGYEKGASGFYGRTLRTVEKWWKVPVDELIPSECRKTTPFSMALLFQMMKLVKATRENRSAAHALLVIYWTRRQESRAAAPDTSGYVTTRTEGMFNGPRSILPELMLQESTAALMLSDIQEATDHVKDSNRRAPRPELAQGHSLAVKKQNKRLRQQAIRGALQASVEREAALGPSAHVGPPREMQHAGDLGESLHQLNLNHGKKRRTPRTQQAQGHTTTVKRHNRELKQQTIRDALQASVEREEALRPSAHVNPPSEMQHAGELGESLHQLNLNHGKRATGRLRRQHKLQQRQANKTKEMLPSERFQPGTFRIRSMEQVDTDRLVSSMASLTPAGPSAKAYEMRADVVDDMDEVEDEDSDSSSDGVKLP